MTVTATARSLLVGDEKLGTDDDGPTLSKCASRLIDKNPSQAVVLDLESLDYRCETSVRIESKELTRSWIFTLGRGARPGKLYAVTDYGPYSPGTTAARNNAHVIAKTVQPGSEFTIASYLNILGPHDLSKPNRSPDIVDPETGEMTRDCLEQRCGVWVVGPFAKFKACAVNIENVWGDFIDFGPGKTSGLDECVQQATVVPGRWVRNGRVGIHALCRDLQLQGGDNTLVDKVVSDFYHVEIQSTYTKSGIGNHQVQGIHVGSVGRFAGVSGIFQCGDILINACSRESGPVNLQAVPRTGYWFPSITMTSNYWNALGASSMVLNVWACKQLLYKFNKGPIRRPTDVGYHNCPNAAVDLPTPV